MLVQDYMTPDPVVVSNREPVLEIAELIRRHRIHQVPIVDDSDRLVGIVTDRDLRSAIGPLVKGRPAVNMIAEDIMTSDVVTVTPGENLKDALNILCHHHFGALPVVVGDHVVGILSTRDLLRRLAELLENAAAAPHHASVPWPVDTL